MSLLLCKLVPYLWDVHHTLLVVVPTLVRSIVLCSLGCLAHGGFYCILLVGVSYLLDVNPTLLVGVLYS